MQYIQDKKKPFGLYAILAIVMVLASVVLAGCVQGSGSAPSNAYAPQGAQGDGAMMYEDESPVQEGEGMMETTPQDEGMMETTPQDEGMINGEGEPENGSMMDENSLPLEDTMMAENKTGMEKIRDAMMQAVADGTYAKNVTYNYHSGPEIIEATISVEGDVVTSASVVSTGGNQDPYSLKLISAVNGALPDLVVGKKITELDIPTNVAGSSLTTAAFKGYVQDVIDNY